MKNPKKISLRAIVIISLGVVVIWFGNLLVAVWYFEDWGKGSQFGDLFGASSALFSGLAFVGLIYAIILQSRELGQQREELRLQREEMVRSREQLAEQARAQQHSLKVAITQLKIAALQAYISAEEMDSLEKTPGSRAEYSAKIREIGREMQRFIDGLES